VKLAPPSNELERRQLEARLSREISEAHHHPYRVLVYPGRFGWVARAVRLRADGSWPLSRPEDLPGRDQHGRFHREGGALDASPGLVAEP